MSMDLHHFCEFRFFELSDEVMGIDDFVNQKWTRGFAGRKERENESGRRTSSQEAEGKAEFV